MSVDRYAQCDDTCTVDCGACKGAGRPSGALAANPRRLAWFTDDELVAELERRATRNRGAEAVRDALLKHHPIAHTMTGPLSGCRCGQVGLGQDVIAHVTEHLRAALAPQAGDGAR